MEGKSIDKKKVLTACISIILIIAIAVGSAGIGYHYGQKNVPEANEETEIIEETTEKSEEDVTVEESTTTTVVETTKATEKAKVSNNEKIELTRIDTDNLKYTLEHLLWFGFFSVKNDSESVSIDDKNYDCTSKDAINFAYNTMFRDYAPFFVEAAYYYDLDSYTQNTMLYGCMQEYNFFNVISHYGSDGQQRVKYPDPKGMFDEYMGYYKIDAEYVDKYLETIFNVKPDHSLVYNNSDNHLYYSNGYYYSADCEGGDGAGPDIYISNLEKGNDGKYEATASYYKSSDVHEHLYDVKVVADLKTVDGNKVWSIYKIERLAESD